MTDRLYCALSEVLADLDMAGVKSWSEASVLDKIRSASDFIERRLGQFMPSTESRRFDGAGRRDLFIDPLLAATSLTDDGDVISSDQYLLYPRNRCWPNGPYTRLTVDPDATELGYWTAEADAVAITGRWGKYEETIATGSTVANTTQIAAGATGLLVSNGSKVSPGMVLKIESEQLLVEATGAATDSTANTAEALDVSEEEVDVNDASLVNTGEVLRIDFEQMKVLDKASNTLLVIRGYNGSKKVAHDTSKDVYVYRTFTVKRGANGTTDAAHAFGAAISRYLPPRDVLQLCVQLAALKMKIAETGYSGVAGSTETGEAFYYKEFPEAIKQVERNYRIVGL